MKTIFLSICIISAITLSAQNRSGPINGNKEFEITKSDAEWKKQLPADVYTILRKKGTERAFTGIYYDHHENGVYRCAGCGNELFSSAHKFESGTGWPSFYKPIAENRIRKLSDNEYGMTRTEVICARCGGHLGHVFDDGPEPTGLRFCMNSAALTFKKK